MPEPEPVSVEELRARPSVEDAAAELEAFLAEVRGRMESRLGLGGWTKFTEGSRSGCGLNLGTAFERRSVPSWKRTGPIPDADWPRVLEIVTAVGERYGFGPPRVVLARPGQYDATAFSAIEASFNVAGDVNTAVGARTGCHPTAAALAERAGPPS